MKSSNNNTQSKTSKNKKISQEKVRMIELFIKTMGDEQKHKFWIKTLLSAQKIFPEIIKRVDNIIELQASSVSFASDIYGSENPTMKQFEKVINLTDRKSFLLNLNLISQQLTNNLEKDDKDFLEKRYIHGMSVETLAEDFSISTRTVYRRIDKLVSQIQVNILKKNWSLKFLESQIKNEYWLQQKFISHVTEYCKNLNYNTAKLHEIKEGHHLHHSEENLDSLSFGS